MTEIEKFKERIQCSIQNPIVATRFEASATSHDKARWLMEAKGDLQRCVDKLAKVLEVEG